MGEELKKLSARHDLVIKLHLEGLNNREVAVATGFCEEHVPTILGCQLAKGRIEEARTRLVDDHIDAMNLSRKIAAEAAPRLTTHMIDLALNAEKEDTQLSACAKALQFAEGGGTKEQEGQTAINIYVKGENGEGKKRVDIFDGAAIETDVKAGSKALATAEGTEVLDE